MSFYACGCETTWVSPSIADTCSGSQYLSFMSLVDLIIRYACKIADPCNRVVPKAEPANQYDFIVIGAGSGGSTIAGRLAEINEWNTLLLEAGMDEPPATQIPAVPGFTNTAIDWNFTTQQESVACLSSDGVCTWPRGKVLGGTSVLNGMMYMTGTRADFQRWVDAGNTEWSYDDLLPVYKEAEGNTQVGTLVDEKYHGTKGPFTTQQFNYHPKLADDFLIAANQSGWPVSNDLTGDQHIGFAIAQTNNRDGARLSLAKAFVRPHKNDRNLDVMINSTVTRILIEGEGDNKRAYGVEFVYNGTTFTVNATKEVILAAGAVQTPQVLLLSGIGGKEELDAVNISQIHNLTGVGKGIKNHVSFPVIFTINETDVVDLNFESLDEYVNNGTGPLSGNGMSQLTARIPSNYTAPNDPDIQLFFSGMDNTCAYDGEPGLVADPEDPTALRTLSINCVNLRPKSTGQISLLSNNPFDPPKIVANYLTHPDDIKVVLAGIRLVQKLAQAPILREKYNFTLQNYDYGTCSSLYEFDSDDFWECAIRYDTYPENHQCASCKIGPQSNPEACVNQRLQVHGIPNLRITDASVLYTTVSGNTQATIVAIAQRASDFIRYACKIADPCNRVVPNVKPANQYDFIVIGAGSGGSTIAGRLAEINEWNTLLLEAGMDEPPATQIPAVPAFTNTAIDWNFTTQQESVACLSSDGVCTWPRGKVLGGSSVFNGMMYLRGTPADYQRWVDAGNTEWSYDDLLQVFKETEGNTQVGTLVDERYHGTKGPFTIQQFNSHPKLAEDILIAANQSGWPVSNDLNGDQYVGFAIAQTNNRDGARLSLAKAFVRPHKNDRNLDVMINSTVTRILIDGEGDNKRAYGVEFVYNGTTFTVNATKEVILAAGAVQTPQVLLLSGIGGKEELDAVNISQVHNLTGVGKGIKNHVSFSIVGTINETDVVDLNYESLSEYFNDGTGPLSGTGMSQLTARIPSNYTAPNDPDIQLFFNGMDNTCAYDGEPGLPTDPEDPTALRTLSISCVNLHPKSSGQISLLSNNPFDPPKIVANYLTHPDDIKVVLAGLRLAQKLTQAQILQEKYNFTLQKYDYGNCSSLYEFDSDDFWECAIRYDTYPENHQSASCKIGPQSNPEACVNQRLQVHGIPNLRITDASVIYTPPSGNTQATIVAIAQRASDFIRQDYGINKNV